VLGAFNLLLALAALGAAGYLYFLLIYQQPVAHIQVQLEQRLAGLEAQGARQTDQLAELVTRQREALDGFRGEQQQLLEQTRSELTSALADVQHQAPPSPGEWKLAEVEYLLRIANHRVLMERDVAGAQQLLAAADAILAELDDFALYPVRARLADERLALASLSTNDLQGVYLRIEAVKNRIAELPLRVPQYLVAQPAEPSDAAANLWDQLVARLSEYLKFRRFDGTTKPLLAPEEAVYLELNLRLMLERAQLALLRREQLIYEQSLTTARDWLLEFQDGDERAVRDTVAELDAARTVQLNQLLPDISGSLNTLLSLRRNAS
jgi:uroporphyrin-3 C-methyltransferase